MRRLDAINEAHEKSRDKNKTLNQYVFTRKGSLLGVKTPGLRKPPGVVPPADRKERQPRKRKGPPAVENQPDIAEVLSKILQKESLDIIPIEISVGTDPVLIAQDENSSIEEKNEASEELLLSILPLAQDRPTSLSGSPELELPAVETMVSWINNSRLFDNVLPRQ
jgi:hypothetical protein